MATRYGSRCDGLCLPLDLIWLRSGVIDDAVQRNPGMMGKNGHFWHPGGPAGTHQTSGRLLGNFLIVKSDPVIFPVLKEFLPRSEAVRGLTRRGKDENLGVCDP